MKFLRRVGMIIPGPLDLQEARMPEMRPEWARKEKPKPVETGNSFESLDELEESFPTLGKAQGKGKGSKGRGKSSSKGLGKEEVPVGGKGRGKAKKGAKGESTVKTVVPPGAVEPPELSGKAKKVPLKDFLEGRSVLKPSTKWAAKSSATGRPSEDKRVSQAEDARPRPEGKGETKIGTETTRQ